MSTPAKVVEDGLSQQDERRERGPRWGWLAAGVVLGLGLSLLVSGPELEPTPPLASEPDPLDVESDPEGISEVVPGFPDGLVVVSSPDRQTLELITWPISGALFTRPIPLATSPGSEPVSFDSSGRRIASLRIVPGELGFALYAGAADSISLVAVDVTGFAWHDSEASSLIYSTVEDGTTSLWRSRSLRLAPQPIRVLDFEGVVVGWGDWGVALQDSNQETITVIDEGGEIIGSARGRFLGSDRKGVIAVHDGHILAVAASGFPVGGPVDAVGIGEPRVARFSPDAERVAVQGTEGVAVYSTVYGELVATGPFPAGTPEVAWSSDGRFVISPSLRGLIVLDVSDGTFHSVLNQPIHGVAVLPLSS